MIYDTIENASVYKGIHSNLDKALDFISKTDLKRLPLGITEIDGENIYINVMEVTTIPSEKGKFEAHAHHFDIQLDIDGSEVIETGAQSSDISDTDEEKDFYIVNTKSVAKATLYPGVFTICFPREAHKPSLCTDSPAPVKKAVVKILE